MCLLMDDIFGIIQVAGFHVKWSIGVKGVVVLGIVSIRDQT